MVMMKIKFMIGGDDYDNDNVYVYDDDVYDDDDDVNDNDFTCCGGVESVSA